MLEPTTIAIGLSSFLGGIFSGIPGNLAGKAVDKVGNLLTSEALVRSAGHFGMVSNHDAERAVRRAQMASLKCLLNAYYESVPVRDEADQFPLLFIDAGFRFAAKATARCNRHELALKAHVLDQAITSLNSALAQVKTERLHERARALRGLAEQAAFEELKEEVGKSKDKRSGRNVVVPDGFRDLFFHGRNKTHDVEGAIVGWYDGFVLFAAKALKGQDTEFAAIYEATRLGGIIELAFDTNEIALLTQASVATLNDMLTSNADRIANLESLFARSVVVLRQISDRLERIEKTLGKVAEQQTELQNYALEVARDIAEGFIREMASKVARDKHLNLDGMKEAVRNALDIYEKEIAGRPAETNFDDIVNRALSRAKEQVDKGQSGLARATLRRAAEERRREKEDYLERFEAGVTPLYHRERDIALAVFDGEAAAEAVTAMANALHANDRASAGSLIASEADAAYKHGDVEGSNVHLIAAIALRRSLAEGARGPDERGSALNDLGIALGTLGERESGPARLKDAVQAFRAALTELKREEVPLDWAETQNKLGLALYLLGERGKRDGAA